MSKRKVKNSGIPVPTSASTDKTDPTINVQNLLIQAVKRQDDLHNALVDRMDERFMLEKGYVEQRLTSEKIHVDEVIAIRASYEEKLREAESSRINAIRQMDATAVGIANDRATQQAAILANQVATSADTLRTLVASTATSVAQQLASVTAQLTDRLAVLERANYEDKGKEKYVDPMITTMLAEIKALRESSQTSTGKGAGMNALWIYIVGAIGMMIGIITLVMRIAGV